MKIQFTPPHPRKLLLLLITLVIKMQFVNAQLTATLTTNNISCFGVQDGSITATATGGTAPYTFNWSNQETGQTIAGLAAGYYRVSVKDDFGVMGYAEVTLTEPEILQLEPDINLYSNGYNISCYNCFNGSITLTMHGGTAPFAYVWNDGNTNKNRMGLAPGNHAVTVTDANGCEAYSESMYLNQPERSDWTMTGNSGSNPITNFIGTTDNKDLKFRTNNMERLSLNANGDIKMSSLSGNGLKIVYVDSNGVLRTQPTIGTICNPGQPPLWFNTFSGITKNLWTCDDVKIGMGELNPLTRLHVSGDAMFTLPSTIILSAPYLRGTSGYSNATTPDYTWFNDLNTGVFHPAIDVIAFTNGGTESMRMVKDAGGNVIMGIGLDPLTQNIDPLATPYKLMVGGKIGARDIVVRNASLVWPDYVFNIDYKLKPLPEIENYIKQNHHLPDVPNAASIANTGQEIGTLQILQQQKIEDIYLYLIALEKRVKELEKENLLLKK